MAQRGDGDVCGIRLIEVPRRRVAADILDGVGGQADAIHGDRALACDVILASAPGADHQQMRFADRLNLGRRQADATTWPPEVAAEAVGQAAPFSRFDLEHAVEAGGAVERLARDVDL